MNLVEGMVISSRAANSLMIAVTMSELYVVMAAPPGYRYYQIS